MRNEMIVRCDMPECREPAGYKVAAPWSDGRFSELKTYGFACPEHIGDVLRSAEGRWLDYEPVTGEIVQDVGIYRFVPGRPDRQLERDFELEENLHP